MPEPSPVPAATPEAGAPASGSIGSRQSRWPWLIGLLIGWATITLALRLFSGSEWWLCAMGALGLMLVIWPGPKSPKPKAAEPKVTEPGSSP